MATTTPTRPSTGPQDDDTRRHRPRRANNPHRDPGPHRPRGQGRHPRRPSTPLQPPVPKSSDAPSFPTHDQPPPPKEYARAPGPGGMLGLPPAPNLYKREQKPGGESTDNGADEVDKLDKAAAQGARRNWLGGDKQKGSRGWMRVRRNRMILGAAGAGGLMSMVIGGLLFFGQAFGLPDLNDVLGDFELGPNESVRSRRQRRLIYDFFKDGRAGVREGRKVGRYNSRFTNWWQRFNMGRFTRNASAAGWEIEYDWNARAVDGSYINTTDRKAPRFRDGVEAPENWRRNVPTRMANQKENIDFSFVERSGGDIRLRGDISQIELRGRLKTLFDSVYPKNIGFNAIRRTYFRSYVATKVGFDFGHFFTAKLKNTTKELYERIYKPSPDLDPQYQHDGMQTPINPDTNEPIDGLTVTDSTGETTVVDVDGSSAEINKVRADFDESIASGISPRDVTEKLSTRLFGSLRGKLALTGSALLAVVSIGCIAQQLSEDDVQASFNRFASVLRYGSDLVTIAHEIRNGGFNVSLESIGDIYHEFISYKKIVVDDSGNWVEIVKSIGDAATVQRANGKAVVDGQELGAENYINVPHNAAARIVGSIGDLINRFPGTGEVCNFLSSFWGQALGYVFDLAECIAGALVTCLAKEVGTELLMNIILGKLLTSMLGLAAGSTLGVTGFPFVPESANILSLYWNTMESEEGRTGIPITNEQYNKQILTGYLNERQEKIRQLPFMERYFAVSTPGSIGQQIALWKTKAQHRSYLENAASLLRVPFDAFSNLFTTPAYAQTRFNCLSENDARTIEAGGSCVQLDNYGNQKYAHDPIIQCDGKSISLLDGWNVDDTTDNDYGSDWVEEQVLKLFDENEQTDCTQFNSRRETALKMAEVCHGLTVNENDLIIDHTLKYSMYSDPQVYGTAEAIERNNDYREFCTIQGDTVMSGDENIDNRQMYALIGRYVDDIMQQDGLIYAGGGQISLRVPSGGGIATNSNAAAPPPAGCATPDRIVLPEPGSCIGVPEGVVLEPYNDRNTVANAGDIIPIVTPGQIIDGKEIFGCIDVSAPNVIIRNSRIVCSRGRNVANNHNVYDGAVYSGSSNLLIERSELTCLDPANPCDFGADGSNFTIRLSNIHGSSDGIAPNQNVHIEYNYIHDLVVVDESGNANRPDLPGDQIYSHSDGIQVYADGAQNITIIGNHIQGNASTADDVGSGKQAILVGGGNQASNVTITQNHIDGVHTALRIACVAANACVEITNNIIDDTYLGSSAAIWARDQVPVRCNRFENGSFVESSNVLDGTANNGGC